MPDQVAIVEDDVDQRSLLDRGLRLRGFSVASYSDRPSARSAFAAGRIPDLAILDVNLNGDDPDDRDGFELCRELLALPAAEQVPVIFLTRLEDHRDQLEGATLAVAYLQKPPDLDLLAAQVRSLLAWSRRLHQPEVDRAKGIRRGQLCVDPGTNRATWGGRDLELTYCEFEILAQLAERDGRVATYDDLCEAIGSSVTDNTIATHVQHIRDKFQRVDPEFPRARAIRAVSKRGYAWETPPQAP
ncbi:MAG: response regulator transcription factor [Myxococcota bacterium]